MALVEEQPPSTLPRGQNETRLLRCFCGVVLNCQSYSLSCRSMYPPGTFTCYTRPDPTPAWQAINRQRARCDFAMHVSYHDVVLRAGLEQQHRHVGIFGQATGDHGAGGPATHDNVCCSRSSFAYAPSMSIALQAQFAAKLLVQS